MTTSFYIYKKCIFLPNQPTGPIRSSSRDVYIYIDMSDWLSPFHVIFVGLLFGLRGGGGEFFFFFFFLKKKY